MVFRKWARDGFNAVMLRVIMIIVVGLDMSGNLPAAMARPGRAGGDITSLTEGATHTSTKFGNWK